MEVLYAPLGWVMKVCYDLLRNYGLAIILFTLLTKVILFPMSLWVHANGIKMVRIEPAVNRLKIKYFGDEDTVAEETSKLYKKEHYSPFASIIPVAVQLLLLLGLIQIIYHPLTYVLALSGDMTGEILKEYIRLLLINIKAGGAHFSLLYAVEQSLCVYQSSS